jgi:hypothetical protein
MPSKPTKPRPVLSDHKRQGKQLIPPFVAKIGMPQFSSWIDKVIPEVIWIALLHRYAHVAEGNDLAVELARIAQEACSVTPLAGCHWSVVYWFPLRKSAHLSPQVLAPSVLQWLAGERGYELGLGCALHFPRQGTFGK